MNVDSSVLSALIRPIRVIRVLFRALDELV